MKEFGNVVYKWSAHKWMCKLNNWAVWGGFQSSGIPHDWSLRRIQWVKKWESSFQELEPGWVRVDEKCEAIGGLKFVLVDLLGSSWLEVLNFEEMGSKADRVPSYKYRVPSKSFIVPLQQLDEVGNSCCCSLPRYLKGVSLCVPSAFRT